MTIAEQTDETLMLMAAKGDQLAFTTLASRQLGRLQAIAYRVVESRAEAEEIAQEAVLRAWKHAKSYDPARAKVTTWLHRITLNLALDRRRAMRGHAGLEAADEIADQALLAPALIQNGQRRRLLAQGIAAMPARQRQALHLTYFDELPGQDAAGKMGISARALEGLLHRGRHFLRQWLTARDM
jgi:RNA polymerase sigma-70 factor (ECF subfamily)